MATHHSMETSANQDTSAMYWCGNVDLVPSSESARADSHGQPDTPAACSRKAHSDTPSVCVVHGCNEMLEKAYDKKCRTCAIHRQAAVVEVNGSAHRFCQKCSRFHLLNEFDGNKRNCRQRLHEHNYRQRRLRMLRKAAQQSSSPPVSYAPLAQDTIFSGNAVHLQPCSRPQSIVPQRPIETAADLGLDIHDFDFLNGVDDDDLFIQEVFDSINSVVSEAASFAKVPSVGDLASAPPAPTAQASAVPMMIPQRAFLPVQNSGNFSSSASPSTPSNVPIELDEFLWLEQSLAQSTANLNYNFEFPDLSPCYL